MEATNLSEAAVYHDSHPLVSLVSASFWVISKFRTVLSCRRMTLLRRYSVWALSWTKFLIAFVTITVPRLIYFVLSYSLTLTVRSPIIVEASSNTLRVQLNFWSFAIIFAASGVGLNYWIRFRYLNTYSQLKEPPLVKPDPNELHPDVNSTELPPAFHNYLDDFLQAVRVFGFLEKPVNDILNKSLHT